jgi:hypothetical protein
MRERDSDFLFLCAGGGGGGVWSVNVKYQVHTNLMMAVRLNLLGPIVLVGKFMFSLLVVVV